MRRRSDEYPDFTFPQHDAGKHLRDLQFLRHVQEPFRVIRALRGVVDDARIEDASDRGQLLDFFHERDWKLRVFGGHLFFVTVEKEMFHERLTFLGRFCSVIELDVSLWIWFHDGISFFHRVRFDAFIFQYEAENVMNSN